jgi:hypothetical protein
MKETNAKTQILKDNGIIVVTPSAELMTGLKKIGASMLEKWKEGAGSEGEILLESYQAN